ncbi:MAG: tetratricopeptide repeat protein [Oscillatoria sp. SIO1A7]|nr:tetratricopeptide repeat protein [Oscillatoria sp. SIO1A7]
MFGNCAQLFGSKLFGSKFSGIIAGAAIVLVQSQVAWALSYQEVSDIAKAVTARIDGCQSGSGVIFQRQGKTYSLLTAAHTVENAIENRATCLVITADEERHRVEFGNISQPVPGVDLAVIEFNSDETYSLAQFGDSRQVTGGETVYIAGAPEPSPGLQKRTILVTAGSIIGRQEQGDGYALIYDSLTRRGMSGGPVFSEAGKVIGIHGRGDETPGNKINLGIPIEKFLASQPKGINIAPPPAISAPLPSPEIAKDSEGLNFFWVLLGSVGVLSVFYLATKGISVALRFKKSSRTPEVNSDRLKRLNLNSYPPKPPNLDSDLRKTPEASTTDAETYFNRGIARYNKGDIAAAISDYNKAIEINPSYAIAYLNRGIVRYDQGDIAAAISDYSKALEINHNNAKAYNNRGIARKAQGDIAGAISDYNKAIEINPNYAYAYGGRGIARKAQGDFAGAISDYNKAIEINPKDAIAYCSRGIARYDQGDFAGAISDYNKAIEINPNFADAYNNRGVARYNQGDFAGAISDYNKAIEINPNNANAYNNRGNARANQEDFAGAISDYNKAIEINPKYASAYHNRGNARRDSGDKRGAIGDFRKAADLFLQEGNQKYYQDALNRLKELE